MQTLRRKLESFTFKIAIAASLGASLCVRSETTNLRKIAPGLCVGLRGNGELIFAHFNSVARILEHYGMIDGLVGGSSGSITSFLYESVTQNPALRDCVNCSEQEIALRASLMMKSLWGYAKEVSNDKEFHALSDLGPGMDRIKESLALQNLTLEKLTGPLPKNIFALKRNLENILLRSDLRALINPEVFEFLKTPNPLLLHYRIKEILATVEGFGTFKVPDNRIFFRPGVLNFDEFSKRIGRIGNFYAGRGGPGIFDQKGWKEFLDKCASASSGLQWKGFAEKNPECAESFKNLVNNYRSKKDQIDKLPDSRLNDLVGDHSHVVVTAGVLEAPEAQKYYEGLERFNKNKNFKDFKFDVFKNMKFGYFGNSEDTQKIVANAHGFTDLKTEKRKALPQLNWKAALSLSPAEPGLSKLQKIPNTNLVSAAGWSDLAPTLAMRNMGCKKVIYITRKGPESNFLRGVEKNFGMTDLEDRALNDLTNPKSAVCLSVKEADAIWVTNWNDYSPFTKLKELDDDSYNATLYARTPQQTEGFPTYNKQTKDNILGCASLEEGALDEPGTKHQ